MKDIKRFQKQEPRCLYKCDVEELKFIEDITLIVSNKHSKFYENFLVSNEFPKDFYFYEALSNMGCQVRSFEELVQEENYSEDILEELHDTIAVNKISQDKDLKCNSILKKIFKIRSEVKYHEQIENIAAAFYQISENNTNQISENSTIKQVRKEKNISFMEEVKIHPLIKPSFIFFCHKPYMVKLKDNFDLPIRSFRTINGSHFLYM